MFYHLDKVAVRSVCLLLLIVTIILPKLSNFRQSLGVLMGYFSQCSSLARKASLENDLHIDSTNMTTTLSK
jgi:hypothetical protein